MKTYFKLMLRSVKYSAARFISIMAIVCVGVAFLTGLTASSPDMFLTLDTYYKKHNVHDINIKSPHGLTKQDIQALNNEEYIKNALGLYITDLILDDGQKTKVARIYGVPFESYKSFQLKSGRIPENKEECIVAVTNTFKTNPSIGKAYTIFKENQNYSTLKETYSFEQLTVVGNAVYPLCISIEDEPSNIGNGTVELIVFVPYESYNLPLFTDSFINLKETNNMSIFSNEYRDSVKDSINKIKESKERENWFYLTLNENISYVSFKGNAEKLEAISKVFPVFFFFVASLVVLTSITRLVEEQRAQTGTLKSLGYSNFIITLYYIFYSLFASLIGCIIGVLLGSKTIPSVIINAYSIMYIMPEIQTKIWLSDSILFSIIITLCVTISAFIACIDLLKEKPATLMIAKAPKPGKRIFLEKVSFLWKRMTFSQKVTARNLVRYKKRFFMTVIGIAGCSALLLTGFGLKDSISDIVAKQFGEIYNYDINVSLKSEETISDIKYIENTLLIHTEAITVSKGDRKENATLYVPKEVKTFPEFINIRNRKTGSTIELKKDSIILTEKMSEKLKIKVGDKVTITNLLNEENEYTVSGIAENYVSSFVYMPREQYKFQNKIEYKTALMKLDEYSVQIKDEITKTLLQNSNVTQVQFSQSIKDSFSNTIKSIDYIVSVIIAFAGALAIIVLYNLTNINISERIKELATLKVLGFHEKETALYVYRETTVLTLIGSILGFVIGIYLHAFVVKTAEVDAVMFGRTIYLKSYIYAFLVTMLFSLLVNLIMTKRIKGIDMVESLKAPE